MSNLARRERGLLLGLVVVTLLSITVLASGLSSVEVQSSRQFTLDSDQRVADIANLSMPSAALSALSFLAGFLRLLLLVLLPFSIYYFIKSSEARKRILIQVLYLTGFTYLILALSQSMGQSPLELIPEPLPIDAATIASPDVVSGANEVPGWVFVIASIAIAIPLAAIAVLVYRSYQVRRKSDRDMATEARWALDALHRGVELESVIFRAYYQLCASSSDRLGLSRHQDMTPTEYEKVLAKSGVPTSPLARLTRLFEKARYGSAILGDDDEQEAVAALRLILGGGG
ncbi:MAG: DUF4129 domain-containing protein [Anaerolineales bacterium]